MDKHVIMIGLFCLFLLVGCSAVQNEKANRLYANAVQSAQRMVAEENSYAKAFHFYRKAKENIDLVLSRHRHSDIAESLLSGEAWISGLALDEFQEMESSLKLLAAAEQDPLSCAHVFAERNEDEAQRSQALSNIAGAYARTGQFIQALETADSVGKEGRGTSAMVAIAVAYANDNQFDKALETAKSLDDEDRRDQAFRYIAKAYADAGEFSRALRTAMNIRDERIRDWALNWMATSYAENGNFIQALETARSIGGKDARDRTLLWIGTELAATGKFPKALETANAIEDSREKDRALYFIASEYAKAGEFMQALETVEVIDEKEFKTKALYFLPGELVKDGQKKSCDSDSGEEKALRRRVGTAQRGLSLQTWHHPSVLRTGFLARRGGWPQAGRACRSFRLMQRIGMAGRKAVMVRHRWRPTRAIVTACV